MEFSWSRAVQVALIGFAGVFIILFILMIGVIITNKLVQLFGQKHGQETKKE